MSKHRRLLFLLTAIRNSFVGSEQVFTEGSCYKLYEIIVTQFPSATPYCDGGHIITEVEGRFYDINGEITDPDELSMFDQLDDNHEWHTANREELPKDWGPFNIYDVHVECPACDEPFMQGELKPEFIKRTRKRYEHKR